MILVGLGTGLMAASILWEYVRMRPDYRFIVDPWSIRGFETPQGWAVATIAAAVLVIAVLVTTGVLKESLLAVVTVAVAATALGVVLAVVTNPREAVVGTPGVWGLAVLAGMAVAAITAAALPGSLKGGARSWTTVAVFAVGLVITALAVFEPLFGGEAVPLWAIVLIGFGLLNVVVVVRPPRELALYRLMINSVLIAWFIAMVMSGSLRSLLATRQFETIDIAAEIRDIQITSGVMLTWAGGLLAFLGTVSLWARRRDQLEAVARARRQLDAARRSAEEMGKTLEESHAAIDEESVAESVGGPTV
jgi:hypothetical protein